MCDGVNVAHVISLLHRPVYTYPQVDRLLGLTSGTARRWINGLPARSADLRADHPPGVAEYDVGHVGRIHRSQVAGLKRSSVVMVASLSSGAERQTRVPVG